MHDEPDQERDDQAEPSTPARVYFAHRRGPTVICLTPWSRPTCRCGYYLLLESLKVTEQGRHLDPRPP